MSYLTVLNLGEYSWRRVEIGGDAGRFAAWIIMAVLVFLLFLLAVRILLGMAAYHDAQAKGNPEALLWALLIGFLGLIPGIIYLCVRDTARPMVCCPGCGRWHRSEEAFCPACGRPSASAPPQANPYAAILEDKAKKELIAAAVCFGVGIVLLTAVSLVFVFRAASLGFTISSSY